MEHLEATSDAKIQTHRLLLTDLHEHVIQGNTALIHQDLGVLERSIGTIAKDSDETTRAAWDGTLEGLSDCTQ